MIECFNEDVGPAETLVVAFTGVLMGLGGVPFEFHRSISGRGAAALFVRDPAQQWYQYPPDVLEGVAARVRAAAATAGAARIVMLGNSMGGFAALLFGGMVEADAVLAFSPQTCIDPVHTDALGDTRWRQWQAGIPTYFLGDLNDCRAPTGRTTICCGADEPLDLAHAQRLGWRHTLQVIDGCDHSVAAQLRDRGLLSATIDAAIGA